MAVQVERIGSIEKHGEYIRAQFAVNGTPCAPLWLSAPEFEHYESFGEDVLYERLGYLSVVHDAEARKELAGVLGEFQTRRLQ